VISVLRGVCRASPRSFIRPVCGALVNELQKALVTAAARREVDILLLVGRGVLRTCGHSMMQR
jgi:hypothetical protein